MNPKRGRWRPMQDALWLLVALATVSMLITLRLGDTLNWFTSRSRIKASDDDANHDISEHLTFQRSISYIKAVDPGNSINQNDAVNADGSRSGLDSQKPGSSATRSNARDVNNAENENKKTYNVGQDTAGTNVHQTTGPFVQETERKDFGHVNTQTKHENIGFLNRGGGRGPAAGQWDVVLPSKVHGPAPVSEMHPSPRIMARARYGEEKETQSRPASSLQALYDSLSQIENSSSSPDEDVSVLVSGSISSIKHHLPLIESAFHKNKASVSFHSRDDPSATKTQGEEHWSVVLCLNTTQKGDSCVVTTAQRSLQHTYGKANIIPSLSDVIMSSNLLCDTSSPLKKEKNTMPGQWYGGELLCYNHKDVQSKSVDELDPKCNSTLGWWVVTDESYDTTSDSTMQYIPCSPGLAVSSYVKNMSAFRGVIVPLPKALLTLDGLLPLVWQVEVLVTSLSPPRVYLHPSGLTWEGVAGFINRKHQKNVSLQDLRQLISELRDDEQAALTLAQLEVAILKFIRLVGARSTQGSRACSRCFQMLEAVVVFSSSYQPHILQITSSMFSERLSSLSDYLQEQNILEDLATMLASREKTVGDVQQGLAHLGFTDLQTVSVCNTKNNFCLTKDELIYLLDTRRDQYASKNWIRLFPTTVLSCSQNNSANHDPVKRKELTSSRLPIDQFEQLIFALEEYFMCPRKDVIQNDDIPGNSNANKEEDKYYDELLNIKNVPLFQKNCDKDPNSLPYLSAMYINPFIQLYPEFSPLLTEYHAYVDYNVMLVQIHGSPKHCRMKARLEDRYDESSWGNFSLGIGENVAHMLVVDVSQPEPVIVSTYKITIHRKTAGSGMRTFDPQSQSHQVCTLKQDCSLSFLPGQPCGLQHVTQPAHWSQFVGRHKGLPNCGVETKSGMWWVPCKTCSDDQTCQWKDAVWQPSGCKEEQLSVDKLKTCFAHKKVLFIGDSTNRGILHYVSERLNGSLQEWDKTHDIKVYPDLNSGRTLFGFAYYPQFWLPTGQRPQFDKALSELIKRTSHASGYKETVIVVGGVHWLGKHHIDMMCNELKRSGLSKSRVVVKGLGAGFHQPISGVHQLSLKDHHRLYVQNEAVLSYANSKNYSTVDTYSMTMARYKEFLQGKCACHFHKVSTKQPTMTSKLSHSVSSLSDNIGYHVEGDVNAVYSEMVINKICSPQGG